MKIRSAITLWGPFVVLLSACNMGADNIGEIFSSPKCPDYSEIPIENGHWDGYWIGTGLDTEIWHLMIIGNNVEGVFCVGNPPYVWKFGTTISAMGYIGKDVYAWSDASFYARLEGVLPDLTVKYYNGKKLL